MGQTQSKKHSKLGEFAATSIAGNDILSSCLYVSGIAIMFAGIYAPLVFFAIVLILYFYKHVYTEVVEALPLNGGAYNCLLNATSKPLAAVAGVMTVLSYIATSVISAKTASEYIHTLFSSVNVMIATAVIIILFMILTLLGVKDSAKVAKAIFVTHLFTMSIFVVLGLLTIFNQGYGFLPINLLATQEMFEISSMIKMLFLAFSASMLGISGFESSANFVEEQKPGVFRKTLRNMLLGVWIFNPLITLVVLSALNFSTIIGAKDFVLAEAALTIGGRGLQMLLVIDATLVLAGAVLASFVGASGLLYRMTLDHCLPSSLLLPKLKNRNQNANRLILGFGALCLSILFLTGGNLLSLAGVYTISFLGVMTFFALGNLILRQNRPDLKRPYQGPIILVFLAASATILGIIGNIMIDSQNLVYFAIYFFPSLIIVQAMVYRDYILEAILKLTKRWRFLYLKVEPWFNHVINPRILLFAHDPGKIFRSLKYIERNETSRNITIIFAKKGTLGAAQAIKAFEQYIHFFKTANVFKNLHIDLLVEEELEFGPELVKAYAGRFKLNRNNVFIGSIHESHNFNFEDLGGVRIIQ